MASAKTKTGVEKAEKTTVLPGFTASETVILAAAFFHSRSADIDFDQLQAHIGSKTINAAKERLRLARNKVVTINGATFKTAHVKESTGRKAKTAKGAETKGTARSTVTGGTSEPEDDDGGEEGNGKIAATTTKGRKRKPVGEVDHGGIGEEKNLKGRRATKAKGAKKIKTEDGEDDDLEQGSVPGATAKPTGWKAINDPPLHKAISADEA